MVPLGDEAQVEARFSLSDILLILTQDRSTVCVEHTIGSEIILDAPNGNPMLQGSSGSPFRSVWILTQDRSTVCVERTIGSEIILHALDGAPW